jgi:hypothetical protein
MLCILELAMIAGGIALLVTGRMTLGNRVSRGVGPRIAGVILLLPLPLALGFGFVYGVSMAAKGRQEDTMQMALKFAPIEIGIILACLLVALGILFATSRVPERRRRRDDDEDDDYPRRRRRQHDDEDEDDDEDRPRARRRRDEEEDEEEDDVPRKRRRRYDDEDDPDPGDEHIKSRDRE